MLTDSVIRHAFKRAVDAAIMLSDDPVTRNGAVVIRPGSDKVEYGTVGANRFITKTHGRPTPPGWVDRIRVDRPFKYSVMQHAEVEAIRSIPDYWDSTQLVAVYAACSSCAREIINAGIKVVHTFSDHELGGIPARWAEDIRLARELLNHFGVKVVYHADLALNLGFLFDGRMVYV